MKRLWIGQNVFPIVPCWGIIAVMHVRISTLSRILHWFQSTSGTDGNVWSKVLNASFHESDNNLVVGEFCTNGLMNRPEECTWNPLHLTTWCCKEKHNRSAEMWDCKQWKCLLSLKCGLPSNRQVEMISQIINKQKWAHVRFITCQATSTN